MCDPRIPHFAKRISQWAATIPRIGCVYLYGSLMRGQAKPDSDLDIMVVAPEGFVQLMAPKWSEELQEELRVRIDIRGHTDVGPDVIERVKNEGRRIFSRGTFDLFTAFEDDIDVVDPFED